MGSTLISTALEFPDRVGTLYIAVQFYIVFGFCVVSLVC